MKFHIAIPLVMALGLSSCIFQDEIKVSEEALLKQVSFRVILNSNSTYPRPGLDTVALVNGVSQLNVIDDRGFLSLEDSIQGKINFGQNSLLLVLTRAHGSFADSVAIDSILSINDSLKIFATVHIKDKSPTLMGCSFSSVSIAKRTSAQLSLVVSENRIHN